VSVGFALRATDGLVVIADGRTSTRTEEGALVPDTDHAVKLNLAPDGLPFVAMVLGRSGVGSVLMNEFIDDILASVPAAELKTMTLVEVGELLSGRLEAGAAEHAPQRLEMDDGTVEHSGFHILVAGFGHRNKNTVDGDVLVGGFSVSANPLVPSITGFTLCHSGPGLGTPVNERVTKLFDEFMDRLPNADDDDAEFPDLAEAYIFNGAAMKTVVNEAPRIIAADVAQAEDTYTEGGVGGIWKMVTVTPAGVSDPVDLDIGPFINN